MHIPPPFKATRADCLALAARRGFGIVCAYDGNMPVVSWLPFHVAYEPDGAPTVSFHVARANRLASPDMHGRTWLLAVSEADAYVSPRWYASPQQVPSWLYKAVSLSGPVRALGPAGLAQHLEALSAQFEQAVAPEGAWTMAEISAGRRAMLAGAIVGLTMTVERVEGSFKLNQHKSDADLVAVSAALATQDDAGARRIADSMRAARPQAPRGRTSK